MPLRLSSPAFPGGGKIPQRYTCDGENISPPLAWSNAPQGARSFALIVEDPDAPHGTLLHWGVYDIDAGTNRLREGFSVDGDYPQAHNDMGDIGYGGPCPPPGAAAHHYRFRLFALDVEKLNLASNTNAEAIEKAAQSHILDSAEMIGLYTRQ